ncbi:MAG: cytochrome c oxidase subunit 3 [Flavobacteriaceae bacterium]|nr:cytochrome c oxidase subunit 3 [Flavobacteriaceae bacterium]
MMQQKIKEKSYKQMLWFSMISMTMMFAGLTSAYVVSKSREDWVGFDLPQAFYISTLLIVLSSVTFYLAKRFAKKDAQSKSTVSLVLTLVLGLGFVYFQFQGFQQLIDAGLYFTGKESNVSSSFLYVITLAHLIHIFVGILVLITVVYQNIKGKYTSANILGLELGAIFWHFVDILWIYLFLFFYFIG